MRSIKQTYMFGRSYRLQKYRLNSSSQPWLLSRNRCAKLIMHLTGKRKGEAGSDLPLSEDLQRLGQPARAESLRYSAACMRA